jgi:hypothetical protein
MIPVIIVSYNNHIYVENTINQIITINPGYQENIIIMDNNSSDPNTIEYINNIVNTSFVKVIRNEHNNGPWVMHHINPHIYDTMPDKFILTDPDLEFNKNLPSNFIEIIDELSNKYPSRKMGFALKIEDYNDDMFPGPYTSGRNIYDWESQFWNNKIPDDDYELYYADIDTTFSLYSKQHLDKMPIRIAGNFTARHLPWYKTTDIFNIYEKHLLLSKTTSISSITVLLIPYIENNYTKLHKNEHLFLIENSNPQLFFWRDVYPSWNPVLFSNFDLIASKDKDVVDIGYDIALTSLYLGRISKKVHSINCNSVDSEKTPIIKNILRDNCSNVTIYQGNFGKDLTYETLRNFLLENPVISNETAFINININGIEETFLQELYEFQKQINVPILINLCLTEWKDKDTSRFSFLQEGIEIVENYPLLLN